MKGIVLHVPICENANGKIRGRSVRLLTELSRTGREVENAQS